MKSFRQIILISLVFLGTLSLTQAQNFKYNSYRLGLKAGLGLNMAGLGYQNLGPEGGNFVEFVANDGTGVVPYFGLYGEYLPDAWWGFHLGITYDSRNASVTDNSNPLTALYMNMPTEFDLYVNYLSIEPKLVINQKILPALKTYFGTTLAFNLGKEFEFPGGSKQEISNFSAFALGLNLGFAYDIPITKIKNKKQYIISPFLEASLLGMQRGADFKDLQDGWDDTWSTVSLRAGVFASIDFIDDDRFVERKPTVNFDLILPVSIKVYVREVEELLPLVNHVFFDQRSQEIPSRYVVLTKEQAGDFDEKDIINLANNNLLTDKPRVEQQMFIYHNVMNIFADRMKRNTSTKLTLIGSAPLEKDGDVLAQKVKDYLVNNFKIKEDRIEVVGQELPRIPSGTPRTPAADKPLTEKENRRVEFVFDNVDLHREVNIRIIDKASVDNDMIFALKPGTIFESWSIVINGKNLSKSYGPFENDVERVNPVDLLAGLDEGDYVARVLINKAGGQTVTEETEFTLYKETDEVIGQRYTILFNYAQEEAVKQYEKTIRTKIADRIPDKGFRTIIHGHTDNLGQTNTNRRIAIDRANETKGILDNEFKNDSKNVPVESIGFGENMTPSTFDNSLPEGRFYNRNVTIDIVPIRKK